MDVFFYVSWDLFLFRKEKILLEREKEREGEKGVCCE